MGETEEFNTLAFEKKLMQLKDTQESIQTLSSWCLKQRIHHKKIVSSWLNVLKRVKVEQRLTLFYLANDVIQYSKRKNYEFVESWGLNLQKATPLVRDEKVRKKILRIFKIWEQRSVYDDEFLSDLTGLLSAGAVKKTDDDPLDFQPQQLVNKIRQCTVLETDTESKLKAIHDHDLELSDADALCANLKDRSNKDDVEKELNEGILCVERYTQALQREIVAREALLALLSSANQYYSTQRGEVKVVAYAYKNFGSRVRALKRKLDELIPTLPSVAPSPPQHDEDVPSPGPDEDLDLPGTGDSGDNEASYNIDQTFNTTLSADGSLYNLGLSSFLTADNPMAMFNDTIDLDLTSANKIEVINTRPSDKQDFSISDLLKDFVPVTTSPDNDSGSVASISQKSQDQLPGLDLLTPDSTGNPPPPTSFYGTMEALSEDLESTYVPEPVANNQWDSTTQHTAHPQLTQPINTWTPAPVRSRSVFAEPPASPPPQPPHPHPPAPIPVVDNTLNKMSQELSLSDVDHRSVLPPPPPPPVLPMLARMEDVDHRLLPNLPPLPVPPPIRHQTHQQEIEDMDHRLLPNLPPLPVPPPIRHQTHQKDVDHRNLISLTHQPAIDSPLNSINLDQDYRVPPVIPPSDIVESVDMDLSEDEDHGMYPVQNQIERRNSFNNNKVLVGGNDTINHNEKSNSNLILINSTPKIIHDGPLSAPILPTTPQSRSHVTSTTIVPPPRPHIDLTPPITPQVTPIRPAPPITHGIIPGQVQTGPIMGAASHLKSTGPLVTSTGPSPTLTTQMTTAGPQLTSSGPLVTPNIPPPILTGPPPSIPSTGPRQTSGPVTTSSGPHPTSGSQSAPIIPPLSNPFDNMPPSLQFNMNYNTAKTEDKSEELKEDPYEDDLRSRVLETRNPSPPSYDFISDNYSPQMSTLFMNQRFPRNWGPRTNFRPQNPQFWPRNVPRPNRWMGPRPRFW